MSIMIPICNAHAYMKFSKKNFAPVPVPFPALVPDSGFSICPIKHAHSLIASYMKFKDEFKKSHVTGTQQSIWSDFWFGCVPFSLN